MKFVFAIIGAAVTAQWSFGAAEAASVGPKTPCSTVAAAFDRKDRETTIEVADTGRDVLIQLDAIHTRSGEPGIIAKMSDGGVHGVVAAAIAECREHPKQRFEDALGYAYLGIRETQRAFGVLGK